MTLHDLAVQMIDQRIPPFKRTGKFLLSQCLTAIKRNGKWVVTSEPQAEPTRIRNV